MNNGNYKKKYIKYKEKYLEIKQLNKEYATQFEQLYGGGNPTEMKNTFSEYIATHKELNKLIPLKSDKIRIASFNVHYFTDMYEKTNTYKKVIEDVKNINADVIILQEIIIGGNVHIKHDDSLNVDVSKLYDEFKEIGYSKIIICNSVPSWFNSLYGNAMLIKNTMKCKNPICPELNETIHTFEKTVKTVTVSGTHEGTPETRCYIYITIPIKDRHIHIYGVHLDVADEDERIRQVQYMINNINHLKEKKPRDLYLILGDFNTLSLTEYPEAKSDVFLQHMGKVYNLLITNKFVDLSQNNAVHKNVSNRVQTTWNNTRVDFIFSDKVIPYDYYIYFTDSSDHLPVILDIPV